MLTTPECLRCFKKQAEFTVSLATDSLDLQQEVIATAAELILSFDLDISPPENSVQLYRMISKMTGCSDLFIDQKKQGNRAALKMRPALEEMICLADDPLQTATRLAIAGNIIDYGSHQDFDLQASIDNCLTSSLAINDLEEFRRNLHRAQNILYLADNCGELVFDRMLIELIDKQVTVAVKEKPILNDALVEDAITCGLDLNCRIISNGTDCPGTPLNSCSRDFIKEFEAADLIISKGQGNFETLSAIDAPIYFMLMVKCPVVAKHLAEMLGKPMGSIRTGDLILMSQQHKLI